MFQEVFADLEGRRIHGRTCASADHPLSLLMLPGGGAASGCQKWGDDQEFFRTNGFGTLCVDFVGQGQTGGRLRYDDSGPADTGLRHRELEFLAVLESVRSQLTPKVKLYGSSMGGFNAVMLIPQLKKMGIEVDRLVLIGTGMFADEAYDLPFSPETTAILRTQNSWRNSKAWQILEEFNGDVFMTCSGKDDVIPAAIPEHIALISQNCRTFTQLNVPEGTHEKLLVWPRIRRQIVTFLQD